MDVTDAAAENGCTGRASLTAEMPHAVLWRARRLTPGESRLNAPLFRAMHPPHSLQPPLGDFLVASVPAPDGDQAPEYPALSRLLVRRLPAGRELFEVTPSDLQDGWNAVVQSVVAECSQSGKPAIALNTDAHPPLAAFCEPGGICLVLSGVVTAREDQLEPIRRPGLCRKRAERLWVFPKCQFLTIVGQQTSSLFSVGAGISASSMGSSDVPDGGRAEEPP